MLRDRTLAHRLHKLAHRDLPDAELRLALIFIVGNRYDELDSLV